MRLPAALCLACVVGAANGEVPGLRIGQDFDITEFAGSDLANDITCMTLDPKGRVVVAGRGYIRVLVDADGDGKADQTLQIASPGGAAHGLLWEGDSLFAMVDGGLRLYSISNDNNRTLDEPALVWKFKTGGEHDAHAIRRGPDGWLYALCGNSTGINGDFVNSPKSPVKKPVAGVLVRFSPDFGKREIVADGFRNPFDFSFSPTGDIFTFDSDNERCVSLPWYEGTRCYHVISGGHYGWENPQFAAHWRMPPYFPDVVPPTCDLGRGSPTGVVWQSSPHVPSRFHGLYLFDWTFGRVWRITLEPIGASFHGKAELFVEATGGNGFAPTAAAVHSQTGDMYVAIGGRGTRGAVYRIRHRGRPNSAINPRPSPSERGLEWRGEYRDRILRDLESTADRHTVLRAIAELQRFSEHFRFVDIQSVIERWWNDDDRHVRQALSRLIASLPNEHQTKLWRKADRARPRLVAGFGAIEQMRGAVRAEVLKNLASFSRDDQLAAIRLIQLTFGDIVERTRIGHVWEGYSLRTPIPDSARREAATELEHHVAEAIGDFDRELTRTLAMMEHDSPNFRKAVTQRWTNRSDPISDIHHLIVYSRLRGERTDTETAAVANALLALDAKLDARRSNRDRHWPLRISELYEELTHKDPRLPARLVSHADFGRPAHALFCRAPGFDRSAAARRFVARSQTDPHFAWDRESAELIAALPQHETLHLARSLWGRGGLEDVLAPILAREARDEDAGRLISRVTSPNLNLVRVCITALGKMKLPADPETYYVLIRGWRLMPDGKERDHIRPLFAKALMQASGQKLGENVDDWIAWLNKTAPMYGKKLSLVDGVDMSQWAARLSKINWGAGVAARGREVYAKANCAACHSGGQALGPDLAGVASRFSRDDLMTAIVQPSRDVPARYRATQIDTTDGRTLQGLVIYEAVDGIILQTGATETTRIDGRKIESKRTIESSLMPAGLLDQLDDRQIADLYAYLRSLTATK